MNKRITIIAFLLALIIVLSMALLSRDNALKATDEFYDQQIEEEYIIIEQEEPPIEGPIVEEEVISAEDIQEEPDIEKTVNIHYEFSDEIKYGMEIYIVSEVSGFNTPITYTWKYSTDNGENWNIIEGANEPIYSFILDEQNLNYSWMLTVDEIETPEEDGGDIVFEEEYIPIEDGGEIIFQEITPEEVIEETPAPQVEEDDEVIIIYLEDMY